MLEKFINIFEGLERAYGQFKKNDKKLSVKVEGRPWIEHKTLTKNNGNNFSVRLRHARQRFQ